jgi:hypothetical protein
MRLPYKGLGVEVRVRVRVRLSLVKSFFGFFLLE